MTNFTVGDKVVHNQVPEKVFEVDWVEGRLVGCLKITNGWNIESHVFTTQSLKPYQPEVPEQLHNSYNNPTK